MEFISWKDVPLLTIEEANHYLGCLQDKSFFDVDFDNSFYYSCWNIGIGWCKIKYNKKDFSMKFYSLPRILFDTGLKELKLWFFPS